MFCGSHGVFAQWMRTSRNKMRAEPRAASIPVPFVDACERIIREASHMGSLDSARTRDIVNAESYGGDGATNDEGPSVTALPEQAPQ